MPPVMIYSNAHANGTDTYAPRSVLRHISAHVIVCGVVSSTSEFDYGQRYSEVVQHDQSVRVYSTGERWEGRFRSYLCR